MIIFFGEGRLGNQIFQYAFIKNFLKKKETVLAYNFEEFQKMFVSKDNIINIKSKYLKFIIKKLGLPLFIFLSKIKIISSYKQCKIKYKRYNIYDSKFICSKGILPITFIQPGFFQSEKFFKYKNIESFKIKPQYLKEAEFFLNKINENYQKVFVHVRRNDYVNHKFLGVKGIDLPLSYYKKSIQYFYNKFENPYFIFLSDDYSFVKYCFKDIKNKIISNNSMEIDFAIMTLCDNGILSNSSFSWWGSYLMKRKKGILVPKYWLGFKSKVEYPKEIIPSYSTAIEI